MTGARSLEIRPLDRTGIAHAVDWAAAEGWNPGLDDADTFGTADPAGFFGGYLEGRLIATISAVTYPGSSGGFGFIGFYIVEPEQRGRGFGYQLWQHGMRHLDNVPVVGLDGVVDQQPNYRKSGFVLAHRNIRFAGTLPGRASESVADASAVPFDVLADFDAEHFPVPRPRFVELWRSQLHGQTRVLADSAGLNAYGTIRQCRSGWKIGPLFARELVAAEELLLSLAHRAGPGSTIFLDVPETNAAATRLARKYGMEPMFETARMYRGPEPGLPADRIFGVTTFELG